MNIRLHIDRLTLDGVSVPPGQHRLLQACLEGELARLLTVCGVSPKIAAGGTLPLVFTNSIRLAPGSDVVRLGRQIAQSVFTGIGE